MLTRINFRLIAYGRKFLYAELCDLLERFTTHVDYLKELQESLTAYRAQGINDSSSPAALAVELRWKRFNATIPRAERSLEAFNRSMPLKAPALQMDPNGTIRRVGVC